MKPPVGRPIKAGRVWSGANLGFSLPEVLIATGIGGLIAAAICSFLFFAMRSFSGITVQTALNAEAGYTLELIQSRVRFATSVATDTNGNTLTLGFDTNPSVDSDGDGKAYDDRDYFERFQFVGVNSTNITACAANQLIYFPNTTSTNNRILIKSGVRNLPGWSIFTMTNQQTVAIIRFGVADAYSGDHYQAVDVQGTGIALNRLWNTNTIAFLP